MSTANCSDHQRIPATLDGYQQLRQWAGRWPQRCWAVEGAHGIGRALAQRLVGDGEQVVDVPAKLAARVRVLSVGHGRKSDPDDAVSVAVAAATRPPAAAGRRGGPGGSAAPVDQAAPGPGRRPDPDHQPAAPAAGRPGPRRRQTQPHRQPRRRPAGLGHARRRSRQSPAGSWPPTWSPTSASWISKSQRSRRGSRPRSPSPIPAWSSCSGSGRCWRPGSSARSATFAGSPAASFRRPHRHRPAGGLQRPGHPPPAVAGR